MFTLLHAKAMARNVKRASHGPRVLAKERARKVREIENPKEQNQELRQLRAEVRLGLPPKKEIEAVETRMARKQTQSQIQKLYRDIQTDVEAFFVSQLLRFPKR